MQKKMKVLSLKKETLLSLQEKQMQSLVGGAALFYTSGETSGCPSADCNGTCCKKSCQTKDDDVKEIAP